MKRIVRALLVLPWLLGLGGSDTGATIGAGPPRAEPISIVEVLQRTDRDAILRSFKVLGVVSCRDGARTRKVLWIENIWPYAITESTPERQDEFSTILEFREWFHGHGCSDTDTTVYGGDGRTAMAMRSASTYTYAPLPSWLLLGDDRRTNNWAFPDPENGFERLALAHDSGYLDAAWTDAELARLLQPTPAKASAFADCYESGDPIRCFGRWGPRDGSFVRTGWQLDKTRRSRYLAMLYSASLAREGPEGYRTGWQDYPSSTSRGYTYYRLVPRDTGPEPGSGWIQPIYPDREEAFPIGEEGILKDRTRAPDRMAVVLYGTFRRPAEPGAACSSVRMMPPEESRR